MPASQTDTIFAVSSGAPPAAIAVMRISGAGALAAAAALAGPLPAPRRAALRGLRDSAGATLDRGLVLVFPGPATATGEDLAELHLHGGRAIVAAVEATLAAMPGLRAAEAGEFTRRALANGVIDLAQAEGLADLLAAETEAQRRAALDAVEGRLSRAVHDWAASAVALSAQAEALIDFADEDDVDDDADALERLRTGAAALARTIATALADPPVERLRDGVRVVLAGPPNAGKSSLLNALSDRDAALVSPLAGTTRDRIEVPVTRRGIAYTLIDTAGLNERPGDAVEEAGIARTRAAVAGADIVLWLGDEGAPSGAIRVHARADVADRTVVPQESIAVSAWLGWGLNDLWDAVERRASTLVPRPARIAFNRRQRRHLSDANDALGCVSGCDDLVLLAEHLRNARMAFDAVTGTAQTEQMLDALFGQFCIGK